MRSKAAAIAGQQIDKAATVALDVVDAAKDGARKEGLTLDDANAAMDGLSGKLGRVVDAAEGPFLTSRGKPVLTGPRLGRRPNFGILNARFREPRRRFDPLSSYRQLGRSR